jgi:sirohydrochlorin ferrochelatase
MYNSCIVFVFVVKLPDNPHNEKTSMHALLLIARGSRREASNQEVRELAARLERIAGDRFGRVIPAFLELAEHDIPTGVDLCVESGATTVTAVPYFLAAGRHVVADIPAELEKAKHKHQAVTVHQSGYLGKHASVPGLLLALALEKYETGMKHPLEQATA